MRRSTCVLLSCAVLVVGCMPGGGGRRGGGGGSSGGVGTGGVDGSGTGDQARIGTTPGDRAPSTTASSSQAADFSGGSVAEMEQPDEILLQAMAQAAVKLEDYEPAQVSGCTTSELHQPALEWGTARFAELLPVVELAGLGWPGARSSPSWYEPFDGNIDVLECATHPELAGLNAFALQNAIFMMDPLLNAFAEGAAFWDRLVSEAGGTFDGVDGETLVVGTAQIFVANAQGAAWTVVPMAEVNDRIANSPIAADAYFGAATFVLFHELGHVNLQHVFFNCSINFGVEALLEERGVSLPPDRQAQLDGVLGKMRRATESQADIYGLTLLRELGFSESGPMLFVIGMLGVRAASAPCNSRSGDDLQACLMSVSPKDSHPPLNERALMVKRIILDGEDLRWMLDPMQIPDL